MVEHELLQTIKEHCEANEDGCCQINFYLEDQKDMAPASELRALTKSLQEQGYIKIRAESIGYAVVCLTPRGINYFY